MGRTDAGTVDAAVEADAAPGGTALVLLSIADSEPAIDSTTTVTWNSTGATSCTVTANNEMVASGTSGSVDVLVDGLVRMSASCQPAGRGSRAILGVGPACEETIEVDTLTIDGSGAREGDDPVGIGATSCVDVANMATLAFGPPELTSRIRSAGSIFSMHAGSIDGDLSVCGNLDNEPSP